MRIFGFHCMEKLSLPCLGPTYAQVERFELQGVIFLHQVPFDNNWEMDLLQGAIGPSSVWNYPSSQILCANKNKGTL